MVAGALSLGCPHFNDLSMLTSSLRGEVDDLIVLMHWGREYYVYPTPKQVEIVHSLADSRADLLMGRHPHVVQGYENYAKLLIFYSIGNFFLPPVRNIKGHLRCVAN